MIEALVISVAGVGTVFVVLAVMMFLMIGIGKVFPGEEIKQEDEKSAVSQVREPSDNLVPERIETAAIALAVASYLDKRNKGSGRVLGISGTDFSLQMENLSPQVVRVVVDGEEYRATAAEEGLPLETWDGFRAGTRLRTTEGERRWRSGAVSLQGGYWYRSGWTEGKANPKRVPAPEK
ncbi:MAG: OadG family protein [Dehalococcoidia bacterium]|nr:OadG family protein [Dehalococcoidia bacterium]